MKWLICSLMWLGLAVPLCGQNEDKDDTTLTRVGQEAPAFEFTTLDGNTLPIDHTYLVHAASMLPEAVEALKLLLEDQGKAKSELSRNQFDFFESALAKAQTIELKGDPS